MQTVAKPTYRKPPAGESNPATPSETGGGIPIVSVILDDRCTPLQRRQGQHLPDIVSACVVATGGAWAGWWSIRGVQGGLLACAGARSVESGERGGTLRTPLNGAKFGEP